jgi:hypothetical protein
MRWYSLFPGRPSLLPPHHPGSAHARRDRHHQGHGARTRAPPHAAGNTCPPRPAHRQGLRLGHHPGQARARSRLRHAWKRADSRRRTLRMRARGRMACALSMVRRTSALAAPSGSRRPVEHDDGLEQVLPVLLQGFDGDDRTKAPPLPSRERGAWNWDVPGKGSGARAHHMFAQAMVIGATHARCGGGSGHHRGRTTRRGQHAEKTE